MSTNSHMSTNSQIISEVLSQLDRVWHTVFDRTQLVINSVNKYGFDYHQVNQSADPTIMQIINTLKRVNSIFDAFEILINNSTASDEQKYEFTRILLNSKQTILHMENLMFAMQSENTEDCQHLFNTLTQQAAI